MWPAINSVDSTQGLDLQRASLFVIARLAEYRKVVLDPLFQEKAGTLLAHVDDLRHDHISLANAMILTRNFAHFTPGMQSRIADPSNLSALIELLQSEEDDVPYIAADVLAHALYFAKPKAHPNGAAGVGSSSKSAMRINPLEPAPSVDDLRRAFLPGWRRFFLASSGEDDGDMQLLIQGLDDVCAMLADPTREKLLRVVLDIHLRQPQIVVDGALGMQQDEEKKCRSDVIAERDAVPLSGKARHLQPVLPAPFRNLPEPHDSSFHGSAHLWRFLRKLWLLTLKEDLASSFLGSSLSLSRIQVVLGRWKTQGNVTFSSLTHERRARFLGFIVGIMEACPNNIAVSGVLDDIVGIVDELVGNPTTSGVAYQLLYTVCKQSPQSVDKILQHFAGSDGNHNDNNAPQMSRAFRSLMQGVMLEHLVIRLSVSKIKGQETDNTVTMLDPRAPSSPAIAYAIGLLNLMSARSPDVVPWFIESQGVQVIFDLLLMDSALLVLLPPSIKSVFHSSVVKILSRVLQSHPDTDRFIIADARILHRIVRLAYSLKSHTQLAALELLHSLSKSSKIRDMLFRLEYFSSSLYVVEDWMADCFHARCTDLQVAPPLRSREIVELAHLMQLPFFVDLRTPELMRLSMCFVESRLVEEDSLMIVVGDGRFGKIPAWTVSEIYGSETVAQKRMSELQVMKGIDEEFKHVVSKRSAEGSLMMYKIQREGYWRSTTALVRKHVAKRIEQFVTRDEQFFGHTHYKHASSGLISRACRLLIEDRAELVRRVAFTKQLSEETVFQAVTKRRLSDLLTLLANSQLFAGVSRDKLACLVYRLRSPTQSSLKDFEEGQVMSLMVILEENAKYEVHIKDQGLGIDDTVINGSLHRGSFLGFPQWLTGENAGGNFSNASIHVDRINVLTTSITLGDLKAELGESETRFLIQRCQQTLQHGEARELLNLMTLPVQLSDPHCQNGERDQLQSTALLLLEQLVSSRDFAARMLTNTWTIQIICEVAVSALSSSIVSTALEILSVLVKDEVLCKRFCALDIPLSEVETSEEPCPSWASKLGTFLALVRHFPIAQWATDAHVLTRYFRIQSHVFKNIPIMFKNVSEVWTLEYLQQCQFVFQQDRHSEFQTAEIVAAHLIPAIHQHPELLIEGFRATSMHLDVVNVLSSADNSPLPCESLMELTRFFCLDAVLHAQIWTSAHISIESFDPVLCTVATNLLTFRAATSSSSQHINRNHQMIRTYCEFILLICASDVDEARDVAFRERVEVRFSILSTLIQLLSSFEVIHLVR